MSICSQLLSRGFSLEKGEKIMEWENAPFFGRLPPVFRNTAWAVMSVSVPVGLNIIMMIGCHPYI